MSDAGRSDLDPTPEGAPNVAEGAPERAASVLGGSPDALAVRLGVTLLEISPERAVGTMPVEGNTQPFGLLHGGASCVLAETLGSLAASAHAAELFGGVALGIEINASHHRPVRTGTVTGVATAVYRGRTVASYEIVITDDGGRRVCTARLTCALRRW